MRLIALFFLLIGVGLAGGTVYFVSSYVKSYEARVQHERETEPLKTVKIVAAKVPLRKGFELDYEAAKESLRFVDWPIDSLPEGAFTTSEELFGEEKDEVRIVRRGIEPGELILQSKVSGFGEDLGMSTLLKPGMRAVVIPINAVTGGGGHIAPGDFVDIEWTRSTSGGNLSSVVLLRNVAVIATGQSKDTERNSALLARTVTVEVNQKDAQKLRLAQQAGTLALLLRGIAALDPEQDQGSEQDQGGSIDLFDLPGVEEEVQEEEAEKDNCYPVVVWKAGKRTLQYFDADGNVAPDCGENTSNARNQETGNQPVSSDEPTNEQAPTE